MSESIIVPEILKIPDKLLPIITEINNYRYFLVHGGRGGGKTNAVARLILYLAEKKSLRIVCGRETQVNINESVYSILVDLINKFNLNFEIFATRIVHRETQSVINFRGFREVGCFNIQGLENISLVWLEEAQAISKQTLDVLVPTIRRDDSKIFFTLNRHLESDPVFETFYRRRDCRTIHINYTDNPFCTQALKTEAEECRKRSDMDYRHIWLGEPLSQSEDAVFSRQELIATKDSRHALAQGYGMRIMGVDVARFGSDLTAVVIVQQMNQSHWEVVYTRTWQDRDLNYTTGEIHTIASERNVEKTIIDCDGIGAGCYDSLRYRREAENYVGFNNPPISYERNKLYGNNRTVNAYKLKDLVMKGNIYVGDNEDLIRELCQLRYRYDNHQRRILVSKEEMRKQGVPSGNLCDGLIMACSLIDEVRQKQEVNYFRHPAYSKEEPLFRIMGFE